MMVNLPDNFTHCVHQALSGEMIPELELFNLNAVTVGLIHSNWPDPQRTRVQLDLTDCPFTYSPNFGVWDFNCYLGTITHSGIDSHANLAIEIYQYLQTKNCLPYRYRVDIK